MIGVAIIKPRPQHNAMWSSASRVLRGAAIAGYVYCVYSTVTQHVITFILLQGDSMLPTINRERGSDIVLVEAVSVKKQWLKRNDIVIAKQPDNPSSLICKRLSALEGDRIPPGAAASCDTTTVPRGQVWLLGDNAKSSYDSRHFGPLPYALIEGRVCLRIWPITRFGRVTGN